MHHYTAITVTVVLVCGRPPAGDRGGTETPAAKAQSVQGVSESGEMPGTEGNRILNYFFFGASKNSQLPFLASFLV